MDAEWPFSDPPNTVCLTLKQVLEGAPILYVSRGDDDGTFQFLAGGEAREQDIALVCLKDVLERDPTLHGVADLPLGGSASRPTVSSPWRWTLPGQDDLSLSSAVTGEGWNEERYGEWIHGATRALQAKQTSLEEERGVGSFPRFDYDLEAATLTFSGDERGPLVASILVVGSTSKLTGTWLWGWANPSLPVAVTAPTLEVRGFGETHGLNELNTAKWTGDEGDGWAMTAATAELLGAVGAYRAPTSKGALFLVLLAWQT